MPTKPSRKFLFVSFESLSGDIAWKVQKEGHEVKAYIEREADVDVYDGILDKVKKWEDHVDWADIIVFDDVGFGKLADALRKKGKLVVGGSKYTDSLEDNREFGQTEMKRVGMNVLPHWYFTNFDAAIEFIQKNPSRYVFKPSGHAQNHKDLLFIGEEDDGRDILELLISNKKAWKSKIKTFQLQRYAAGVEIAVGGYFNGKEFLYPINVNFEFKRLFPGDIGPLTGDMGSLMFWSQPNAMFKATLDKMVTDLAKANYVGYFDINCIVNARGIYPLEFTSRFGYPTASVQTTGMELPFGEFLYRLASGEKFEIPTKKGFQLGICCAVSSYLSDDPDDISTYKDLSILFRRPNPNLDGIHIGDLKMVDNTLQLAGVSGYALVVTGTGTTVEDARRQAYNRIKNIRLQNMFYRVDIGERWLNESDLLQSWGYLNT
ncbi:MAG: phosphoribosylamine--glycine ligase [Candidatus Doudnabacteria bacterium RIFCSPLOWO2_02_FULL_42_9]|uniref:phosphoribosylamine--glycine ligase n=1 Tax=Candidatus Doudnabacteria bacterium RIFCSPHIGHO2_01_FULL_41_86 TaxID=1817821 RepID=A0A1F5N7Z3_9BACT|nr:MAG: phosphoribosylamine--glycine ligase [Candidatus Doudnabacteria bacterium RIFCSPHIGHO2_01_FULL_41_86]OGE75708.1 MAG: phosphoribosylamine--glycine ligase [Candidatus Doudnabacteria bacterium RIFCSPHIGHO2_01_43_10]OGE85850.1 MAG: phosphoribosylamine--glycine ligase [Candidatus Doudnabacteria bacterium RIFCSPHIGHO2_12_FULL_42_22]OGE87344.1 MAG: phosphoribosylamine--glycine ligase [Candidatus Doudnabacteria bacterium RIFCSPHIGHO2_02_FULL_42_25]OGE92182.1 MAG: phosphoribosylamine--glycine lig